MSPAEQTPCSFLEPGPVSTAGSLAVLHLKRDLSMPTRLSEHVSEHDVKNEGYDEGRVTNTRFGSFPHSTLIGLAWGSQVRASDVDTGSRGRRGLNGSGVGQAGRKRKREGGEGGVGAGAALDSPPVETTDGTETAVTRKEAVAASSGFIHLLPPTPESWTMALPHRTQVVYTPDYSYILHRLRARPGSVLIEAGAGSGSFSHAAARAVYSGRLGPAARKRPGKVLSFEFHEQRFEKLKAEIGEHGLEDVVHITHRDVCQEGFLQEADQREISAADAIFLDLPAPWLALRHLTRSPLSKKAFNAVETSSTPSPSGEPSSDHASASKPDQTTDRQSFRSPLDPRRTVRICTFSPCVEQVQRTIMTMRQLGWLDIEMVEIGHKRIDVRRERVGLQEEGQRGVHVAAATVDEAVERLKEVEGRSRSFHDGVRPKAKSATKPGTGDDSGSRSLSPDSEQGNGADDIMHGSSGGRKLFKDGRLVHRAEPELKTHTSYLVFALLPQEWSAADEAAALTAWPVAGAEAVEEGGQGQTWPGGNGGGGGIDRRVAQAQ
ncbi:MAG: tRNA (adenine-N(1)-)-methyltransferase catalytic subunit trm61 [Thelocarpon impressellum]|nr:MAG: tRNA (adenine-N(1)-)-methyltransferase catalytic subunit trm61 [Thelocarpon impressellum]